MPSKTNANTVATATAAATAATSKIIPEAATPPPLSSQNLVPRIPAKLLEDDERNSKTTKGSRAASGAAAAAAVVRGRPTHSLTDPWTSLLTPLASRLRDNWNFKGFGMSFYKSLLSWTTVGTALQVPLTQNIGWWERHPVLPTINTCYAVFGPKDLTAVSFFNLSLHVNIMVWAMEEATKALKFVLQLICVTLWRFVCLPIAAFRNLVRPLRPILTRRASIPASSSSSSALKRRASRRKKRKIGNDNADDRGGSSGGGVSGGGSTALTTVGDDSDLDGTDQDGSSSSSLVTSMSSSSWLWPAYPARPILSNPSARDAHLQERLGLSLSWRISQQRGYEFRVSYWYSYLPVLVHLLDQILSSVSFSRRHRQERQPPQQQADKQDDTKRRKSKRRSSQGKTLDGKKNGNIDDRDHDHSSVNEVASSSSAAAAAGLQQQQPLPPKQFSPQWQDWMRRHVCAVGFISGSPTPIPPHFSCSAILTMSGFHLMGGGGVGAGTSATKSATKTVSALRASGTTTTAVNDINSYESSSSSPLIQQTPPPPPPPQGIPQGTSPITSVGAHDGKVRVAAATTTTTTATTRRDDNESDEDDVTSSTSSSSNNSNENSGAARVNQGIRVI